MTAALSTAAVGVGGAVAAPSVAGSDRTPSPTLRQQVKTAVEKAFTDGHFVGMSVAFVRPKTSGKGPKVEYLTFGSMAVDGTRPVTRQTQFEIGSETKIYTAGLLAGLVAQGKVALSDPLQKYAPHGVTIPSWTEDGATTPITLQDLVTHQSGLPDEPANLWAGCPDQKPCATAKESYTEQMLWDGLQRQKLLWKPGTNWLYSNYAFGVLGTVLADVLHPGSNPPAYQQSLDDQFLQSLGMRATQLEQQTARLAVPYSKTNQPVPYWNNTNALAGGGGLISDLNDMETMVEATLGYPQRSATTTVTALPKALTKLSDITTLCTSPTECTTGRFDMGMAWQLYPHGRDQVTVPAAFKDGDTAGMHGITALAPQNMAGVTVMSNGGSTSPSPLGAQLLDLIVKAGPA